MHVLITGAGGFIGAQLVDAILGRPDFAGASISAFDQVFTKAWNNDRVHLCSGDIRDADARALALAQRPDVVFHLAGHFPGSSARVTFAPEASLDAQFARQPALVTETGDRLGFKHDGTLDALVERAAAPVVSNNQVRPWN